VCFGVCREAERRTCEGKVNRVLTISVDLRLTFRVDSSLCCRAFIYRVYRAGRMQSGGLKNERAKVPKRPDPKIEEKSKR
jgi:hypothetical protein